MADSNTLWDWAAWAFSPASSAILVTLLVSLLSPLLIHIYLYRKAPSRELPIFLLAGPSGSGKTSLLTSVCLIHFSTPFGSCVVKLKPD